MAPPGDARKLRTFVAFAIGDDDAAEIATALDRRHGAPGPGLRWVPRSNWHLTLRFLGPTAPEQVSPLAARIDELGRRPDAPAGPLESAWREVGPFPRRRPVAVALELEATAPLRWWADRLEHASRELGWPAERRRFRPHVTLARCRGRVPFERLELTGLLRLDEIVLYRSDPGPTGVVYTPLHTLSLGESPRS